MGIYHTRVYIHMTEYAQAYNLNFEQILSHPLHDNLHTWPTQTHGLSKSTYSPSLLYIPRASSVGFPSFSANFNWAILSNSLAKWRATCVHRNVKHGLLEMYLHKNGFTININMYTSWYSKVSVLVSLHARSSIMTKSTIMYMYLNRLISFG